LQAGAAEARYNSSCATTMMFLRVAWTLWSYACALRHPHQTTAASVLLLLLLLQDKLVLAGKADCAEEPAATVMLAANPVKLAQQRKRSANGASAAASSSVGSGVPGNSAAGGGLVLQLPGSPASAGPGTAASRVRQGIEKQHTSRLRTASRETAE
jgi:hypothetical protein